MSDILFEAPSGVLRRFRDMGDGSHAEVVSAVSGSGGGSTTDRELVATTYLCKSAFAGASAGDTITSTQIIDVTGTPSTVGVVWRNQSTAADLAGAPSGASLELVGSQALTDGQLRASPVAVSGPLTDAQLRAAAVPISASALPLPDGAATSAGLTTINSTLGTPMQQTGGIVGLVAGSEVIGAVNVIGGNATAVKVDGSGVTSPVSIASTVLVSGPLTDSELRASAVPISASSLPLPFGAATSAGLATINSTLGTPMQQTGGAVGLVAGVATIGSVNVLGGNASAVKVDGSAVTQPVSIATTVPVSGPLTDTQLRASSVPVSVASLPLPAGAATQSTAAGIRTDLGTDGTTPPALPGGATGVRGWLRGIFDKLAGTIAVSGTFWQATQPISAATLPLPVGAATESTLAAASAKLPATVGQKISAASLAVVIASDQSSLPVTHLATQRTAGLLRTTGAGTVAAGARSVAFANTGAANATVGSAATILRAGESVTFEAPMNDTLAAIPYSVAGTELLIAEVR